MVFSHFGQEQVSFDRSSSKFVPACKRIDVHETVELCCCAQPYESMKSVICKPHELPPKLAFAILQFSMFGHVWHIFVTLAPDARRSLIGSSILQSFAR